MNYEQSEDAKKCVNELHGMDLREDKEEEKELGPDGHPALWHVLCSRYPKCANEVDHLYVQRAQTKKERQAHANRHSK